MPSPEIITAKTCVSPFGMTVIVPVEVYCFRHRLLQCCALDAEVHYKGFRELYPRCLDSQMVGQVRLSKSELNWLRSLRAQVSELLATQVIEYKDFGFLSSWGAK